MLISPLHRYFFSLPQRMRRRPCSSMSSAKALAVTATMGSPASGRDRARMRRAAELLLETNDSMREIADAIGLKNEFYFSRLFRAKYHLPPATYRREFCGEAAPEDNREK